MNIGIITNFYPPFVRGGAEQVAWRTAEELYRRGHRVFVVSTKRFESPTDIAYPIVDRRAETVYRFFPFNFYHIVDAYKHAFPLRAAWTAVDLWNPMPSRVLRGILKQERPDVMITHNLKGIGMQTASEIRCQGIYHIHTLHDVQLSVPSGLLMYGREKTFLNNPISRWMYEKVTKSIFQSPQIVLSPSRFLASLYHERGFFPKSRMEILPNPTPDMQVPIRPARQAGPIRLLFAGQLEKHKGILMLLDLLEKLSVPSELHIAGEGTLAKQISKRAAADKRVVYHGFISFEYLLKLFDICDATVVPSLCYENSPTVISDSFLAGVPVIASDIGGIGELVQEGSNGLLVLPGNKEALAAAIEKMAKDLPYWAKQEAVIRKTVEPYRLSKYVDHLEQLFAGCKLDDRGR